MRFGSSRPMAEGIPTDIEPTYLGDSVGRWDGDTFVVEVTGFNDNTWLAGVGTVHSESLA